MDNTLPAKVVIGRREGFVSSVGIRINGLNFLYHGEGGKGLEWSPRADRLHAVVAITKLATQLQDAGHSVEGLEQLDKVVGG